MPQDEAELSDMTNLPQVGAEIYAIPWGHIKVIVDKCKGNTEKALFFVEEVIKNNWSRAVLLNFLDTNLYERQGKAISNFKMTLPAYTGDLAQEITKDPYNFDFIAINRNYNERELKDALTEKVIKLLMEMGKGFAFVGREYPLPIAETEEYIDLLFYHLNLHCFACQKLGKCVIEDDANEITEKILEAEVIVWATPIYYYEMSGQMKTMIDRANSLYPRDYKFREVYLLSTAAEDESYTDEKAISGLNGWIDCFEKAEFKGKIFVGGVNERGEIEGHKALDEAYTMGKSV